VRRAREVEEVRALGVVELERSRQGVEYRFGRSGGVAALEAGVVVDADAGEQRHLFPP
jgi:hypothetical protein